MTTTSCRTGELGGRTLLGGVSAEASPAPLQLTGNVTFDAQGNSATVYIVQMASTLTTASNSSVTFVNGALECKVFTVPGRTPVVVPDDGSRTSTTTSAATPTPRSGGDDDHETGGTLPATGSHNAVELLLALLAIALGAAAGLLRADNGEG